MLSSGAIEHRLPFKLASPLKNGLLSNSVNTDMNNEEVRTLFVSGLPMDVRLRELYLLFRCYEGYEGSFLKLISSKPGKPPQPIAFVSFTSRSLAERALEELQGVRFDPASSQTLRLEFARTNSRVSPKQQQTQVQQQSHATQVQPPVIVPPQPNHPVYFHTYPPGINKDGMSLAMAAQAQAAANHSHQSLFGLAPDNSGWSHRMLPLNYQQNLSHVSTPSPTLSPAPSTPHLSVLNILSDSDSSYNSPSNTPTQALENPYYYSAVPSTSSPVPVDYPTDYSSSPPPCSTLFLGNLTSQTSEEEIADLFASCDGFVKAKLLNRGGRPVAFVEFENIECADQAMSNMQGHLLSSSRMSGIRIEYARQKMGESHVKSSQGDNTEDSIVQSITSSTANLNLVHASSISNADTPILPSSMSPDTGNPVAVTSDMCDQAQQPASFHLDLQHGGQSPIAIPSLRPDQYIQHASMSLPAFPVQQGMDPTHHSFNLPRQSPVQSISSLVTQNLSASGSGSPQRVDFGSFPPQNNHMLYGAQGYPGMSRYPGTMLPPGAIGINQQGQVVVNGYVRGMPQSWPYSKPGFHQHM